LETPLRKWSVKSEGLLGDVGKTFKRRLNPQERVVFYDFERSFVCDRKDEYILTPTPSLSITGQRRVVELVQYESTKGLSARSSPFSVSVMTVQLPNTDTLSSMK
jgi:hypothetical protein